MESGNNAESAHEVETNAIYIDNTHLSETIETHSATAAAILDPVTRVSESNIDLISPRASRPNMPAVFLQQSESLKPKRSPASLTHPRRPLSYARVKVFRIH